MAWGACLLLRRRSLVLAFDGWGQERTRAIHGQYAGGQGTPAEAAVGGERGRFRIDEMVLSQGGVVVTPLDAMLGSLESLWSA